MAKCYVSGKTSQFGSTHKHHRGVAGGRWRKRAQHEMRMFKANLQPVTIIEDGKKKKVKLATDVIKRIKKDIRDGKHPVVQLAYPSAQLKKIMNDRKAARSAAAGKSGVAVKAVKAQAVEAITPVAEASEASSN
ncbi:hypothetical protein KBC70_02550 [Candidatus Woesebacteria bacterium]|nr:hypothetical protein [Candidatus Woesebacteria bacterium]